MKTEKLQKGTIDSNSAEAKDRFIRGVAGGKQGGVDLANRTISGIASTINVDRDDEIILPSAFKARLDKFLAGSRPLLAAHTHRTSTGAPGQIGWVVGIKIEKTDVPCDFRFVDDTDSAAERWWKLASDPNGNGIMFSIGFIPVRWVYGSAADLAKEFPEIREALAAAGFNDDDRLRVYTEIELLEISAVPVPSNREAIQILAAKAAGEEGEKALDEFEACIAAKVAEQLKGVSTPGMTGLKNSGDDAVQSAIRNLQSAMDELSTNYTNYTKEIKDQQTLILDSLAEVRELINLSSDTLGVSASQPKEAPAADERSAAAGGSEGATETGQKARAAAASLLKACVPQ